MATSQIMDAGIPSLTVEGDRVMANVKGKVTVITALTLNCEHWCLQATWLDSLHEKFVSEKKDVIIYGINSKDCQSKQSYDELKKSVHFHIFQDNSTDQLWLKLGLNAQDIHVYNRWGKLAHTIPYPESSENHDMAEKTIMYVWLWGDWPSSMSCCSVEISDKDNRKDKNNGSSSISQCKCQQIKCDQDVDFTCQQDKQQQCKQIQAKCDKQGCATNIWQMLPKLGQSSWK